MEQNKIIASTSFGKDSTAMIHLMLEHGERIDTLMYFETGWDFPQMEAHIEKVEKNTGIKTIRVRYYRYFNELLKCWGWPHPAGSWCVRCKINTCNQLVRGLHGTTECIGFNTDEIHRTKRKSMQKKWQVRFPLIEYGYSGKMALEYCYSLGYDWDGLYKVFNRVSCFCCPTAGQKRIEELKQYYPDLYQKYLEMDCC